MVEVDPQGAACATRKRAVFHAMGSKTMQRSSAFPPVFTSYKPLEIERPELRGALSQRRADRDRVCGVDGERSGEQTLLQETTNAVVQRRGAFVIANARTNAERGAACHS